ncbi:uncharacterized protein STEHIDRAFT_143645 [Stereum hirsutum FP-91666 SS1]|uniref:uncharacterized protein n=1 Tax=Stereum hirsutum (strain FP-91666) TaxID=721885 RepID=UPI000440E215|nr:uncharacterized protein STEHIDRAFT_143645 [Stereum hirsutum FP-91666 SS1]EIM92217.1 hypothetical protein STEHIDRAFT_143645 [Stereum hirsutum FP-91666 SS1]
MEKAKQLQSLSFHDYHVHPVLDSPTRAMSPTLPLMAYSHILRRKSFLAVCALLSLLSLGLVTSLSLGHHPVSLSIPGYSSSHHPSDVVWVSERKSAVVGSPTARFRDNLRNDTQYITSWISAGWTNDVMTYANLIYLALITERVPIVGYWLPSHTGGDVGPVPFSEVFDIEYLSNSIGVPVLEWDDVKDKDSTEMEDLGCWSVWEAVQTREGPRITYADQYQKLDISWTPAPVSIQTFPGNEHDPHALFWSVAELTYPDKRATSLSAPHPSAHHGTTLPPDEHLACFDYLYYTAASTSFEWDSDHSPAWRFVAKHFRWTERLQNIADGYLKRIFHTPESDPIPPYIAIHARHGDFKNYCGDYSLEDCFASMDVYARRVAEIQEEAMERYGVVPEHVIVLSDEKDPVWWNQVRERGWYLVESEITTDILETHNSWYPVFVDAVIQSSGLGFIGTASSTMSTLARRRVEDWNKGITRTVQWGRPGADDH